MIERRGDRLCVTAPMVVPNARGLLDAGRAALRTGNETVDLAAVAEADSSALAVLLGWRRAADAAGQRLSFVNVPAGLRSLAELYGVFDLLAFA